MYKTKDTLYSKVESDPIGSGGNAKVFKAKSKDGDIIALKELKTSGQNFNKKKERFKEEIKVVTEIQGDLSGVIPILDYALPDENGKYWYTMPIAQPLYKKMPSKVDLKEVTECIIQLAKIMDRIHERDIVHRDIKSSNIYWYNGSYCFGDFGLVDYPDKEDLTAPRESVGARNTIAPEMRNNAKNSDGKKADVYSLAKTLWMLLTKSAYGFEGTYDDSSKIMGLSKFFSEEHLVELNKLLYDSTREEPELRPTMNELASRLEEWLLIRDDFDASNLSQWTYIQNELFRSYVPDTAIWTDANDIVNVLNLLGAMPSLNHMFLSDGGGLDLRNVSISSESGCIEIDAMVKYVLKPKKLIVENISKDYIWSYFRLELDDLDPVYPEEVYGSYERLTDDLTGNYLPWVYGNYGYYDNGTPLPANHKIVSRYLRGNFVMFSKASIYNGISGTYDGRHDKFDTNGFRNYINVLRNAYLILPSEMFSELANKSPFKEEVDEERIEKMEEYRKRSEKIGILKKFINKNIDTYNFSDSFINTPKSNGDISYVFKYIEKDDGSLFRKEFYLLKDGSIKNQNKIDEQDIYTLFDEMDARVFKQKCTEFIKVKCEENGIEYVSEVQFFKTEGKRISPPKHQFTKEELRALLVNGNDHVNNTLVINNDGYLELLVNRVFDDFDFIKYPVRHEGFQAYNNYVGKYSKLYHFEDTYLSSLQGWLLYLQRGRTVYLDYVRENTDEELLMNEILSFYK